MSVVLPVLAGFEPQTNLRTRAAKHQSCWAQDGYCYQRVVGVNAVPRRIQTQARLEFEAAVTTILQVIEQNCSSVNTQCQLEL